MPRLREGSVWDLSDENEREEAFNEIMSQEVMKSISPIQALLAGEALPEDFPDKGWSYVKEDVHRRFYRKPRKGRGRMQVVCVESVDDFPVVDSSDIMIEEDELLRSVMVILEPRERKVVVLLRCGRTQNEIAKELGLRSHSGVSRLVQRIEAKFRKRFQGM